MKRNGFLAFKQDVESFSTSLGYQFNRIELLIQTFMHASYVNEHPDLNLYDNERLEFLGDAVLDLAASHILMERHKSAKEGDLSKYRAMVVDESALFQVAKELRLGDYLYLGKGEEQCRGREKASILANTMEALLGALYLDAGFQKALEIIQRLFTPLIESVDTQLVPNDFKSLLQEYTQKKYKTLPTYLLVDEEGPAHKKTFIVELTLNGKVLSKKDGKSKKEAEQKAAGEAYCCLKKEKDL